MLVQWLYFSLPWSALACSLSDRNAIWISVKLQDFKQLEKYTNKNTELDSCVYLNLLSFHQSLELNYCVFLFIKQPESKCQHINPATINRRVQ